MSTNIQIDVVLQKLKKISDETAEQNRNEKQIREETLAAADEILQKFPEEIRNEFLKNIGDALENPEGLVIQKSRNFLTIWRSTAPDLYKKKRPAAQRLSAAAMAGVAYSFDIDTFSSRTSKLRVGTPGFDQVVEIGGIFDPGLVIINDVTLPDAGSSGDAVEAVGGLQYFDPRFTKPYQAWSGLLSVGTGAPPLLYQGTEPPPATSQVDVWTGSFDTFSTDCSTVLILPAGGQNSVFIYVHNKIKAYNTFRRIQRRDQARENPRVVNDLAPEIGSGTYYDLRQTNRTIFEYINTQQFTAYQIYAFLVTPKAVKVLNLPAKARDYIQALCPPITLNATANKLTESGGGQVAGYGPNSPTFTFTLPGVFTPLPAVDQNAWRSSTTYGNYASGNDVLAKQYGLGFLQSVDHAGRFFSPAVFPYLKGELNLQTATAKQYAAMRVQLGNRPPAKFLAPCVRTCRTDDTEFYVTRTQPATINNAIRTSLFNLDSNYTVEKGEISDGDVYYCWDWDKPDYCVKQLKALGFTAADLKP